MVKEDGRLKRRKRKIRRPRPQFLVWKTTPQFEVGDGGLEIEEKAVVVVVDAN